MPWLGRCAAFLALYYSQECRGYLGLCFIHFRSYQRTQTGRFSAHL